MCYTVYLKEGCYSFAMFSFLLLLVLPAHIRAELYKIKNTKTNTYIGLEGKYPTWLSLEKSNTFKEKPSKTDERVIIEVVELSGKVWDIEGSVKNLIFYPEHGGANQIFLVERSDDGIIRILNGDQCITFVETNNRFEKQSCVDGSEGQRFHLADENGMAIGVNESAEAALDSPSATEDVGVKDEGGSDQSMALGMAVEAYLGAGGESGGSNALAAATKGFLAVGGSADSMGIGTMDALLIAAQAYLQSAGVANASKMNASKAMAALARVHPIAKQYHSMERFSNSISHPPMTTSFHTSFGSPSLSLKENSMYSPSMFGSHASLYNPMTNLRFGLNSFDPFVMGMGRGLGTPMPYYKPSLFSSSRSWRL